MFCKGYHELMRLLLCLIASISLVGCQSEPDSKPAPGSVTTIPPSAAAKHRGDLAPIGSGMAGGMTPMSGGQDLGSGTGGGIGQAAKDRARGAAAQAGGGNMTPGEESGEQ